MSSSATPLKASLTSCCCSGQAILSIKCRRAFAPGRTTPKISSTSFWEHFAKVPLHQTATFPCGDISSPTLISAAEHTKGWWADLDWTPLEARLSDAASLVDTLASRTGRASTSLSTPRNRGASERFTPSHRPSLGTVHEHALLHLRALLPPPRRRGRPRQHRKFGSFFRAPAPLPPTDGFHLACVGVDEVSPLMGDTLLIWLILKKETLLI